MVGNSRICQKLALFTFLCIILRDMSAPCNSNYSFDVFSPSGKLLAAKEHTNRHIPRVPGKPLPSRPLPNLGTESPPIQVNRSLRDVLLVQSFLLCGLATNPVPAKLVCFSCHKTIRKNQGRGTCTSCQLPLHLKCLGSEFENNRETCVLCSVGGVPEVDEAQPDQQDSELSSKQGRRIASAYPCTSFNRDLACFGYWRQRNWYRWLQSF